MNCARWDLCGGRSVMGVSSAIAGLKIVANQVGKCDFEVQKIFANPSRYKQLFIMDTSRTPRT